MAIVNEQFWPKQRLPILSWTLKNSCAHSENAVSFLFRVNGAGGLEVDSAVAAGEDDVGCLIP